MIKKEPCCLCCCGACVMAMPCERSYTVSKVHRMIHKSIDLDEAASIIAFE